MPERRTGRKKAGNGKDTTPSPAGIDRVVHEPARLSILAVLAVVEAADFVFVLRQTGLTRGNLSSHMTRLAGAGYIEIKKEFVDRIPRTLLSITPAGRKALEKYTASMRKLLEGIDRS